MNPFEMADDETRRRPGFCACGCGQATGIASRNDKRRGWVKGHPVRYVSGHHLIYARRTRFLRTRLHPMFAAKQAQLALKDSFAHISFAQCRPPPTREQMGGAIVHVTAANEFTGAIHCPQRMSSIAILRCAEYQERDHCRFGCPNAATKAEIDLVKANARTDAEDADGAGSNICASCGGWKRRIDLDDCTYCKAEKFTSERKKKRGN